MNIHICCGHKDYNRLLPVLKSRTKYLAILPRDPGKDAADEPLLDHCLRTLDLLDKGIVRHMFDEGAGYCNDIEEYLVRYLFVITDDAKRESLFEYLASMYSPDCYVFKEYEPEPPDIWPRQEIHRVHSDLAFADENGTVLCHKSSFGTYVDEKLGFITESILIDNHLQYLHLLSKLKKRTRFFYVESRIGYNDAHEHIPVLFCDSNLKKVEDILVTDTMLDGSPAEGSEHPLKKYEIENDPQRDAFFDFLAQFETFFHRSDDEDADFKHAHRCEFDLDDLMFTDEDDRPFCSTITHEAMLFVKDPTLFA